MPTKRKKARGKRNDTLRVPVRAVLVVVAIATIVVGLTFAWSRWGRSALNARFQLTAESILVPRQPAWIKSDVRAEVYRDGSLGELLLVEHSLAKRVALAFELHPWVAKVSRASSNASGVVVELDYRRPVAWVEVPAGMFPDRPGPGVLPVDGEGVLLPQADFSEAQLDSFMRISIDDIAMCGPNGTVWGDHRIVDAAKLAAHLQDSWRTLGVQKITLLPKLGTTPSEGNEFQLLTTRGLGIVWGSAPGQERADESLADAKLQRLLQLSQRGTVEGTQSIDLRDEPVAARPLTQKR